MKIVKGKKGTAEEDREFLKEIESWRGLQAKNIALRNPDVSIYELNYAVQKNIDRIIFLLICEDRGIELSIMGSCRRKRNLVTCTRICSAS